MTARQFCNLVYARIVTGAAPEDRARADAELAAPPGGTAGDHRALLAALAAAPDPEG